MKQTTISVTYDEEKISALKMYLAQKEQSVEDVLEKALETLYNKTVPAGVREYLSLRSGNSEPTAEKRMKRKAASSSAVGEKISEDKMNG